MRIDKYWADLLQVVTEDENLRIRKGDMIELEGTDILEFLTHISLFEKRIEKKLEQLKEKNGKN